MKLFIHIGVHKTATSTLQDVFSKNITSLEPFFLYPKSSLKWSGHHDIATSFNKKNKNETKKRISDIYHESRNKKSKCVLLSSEAFSLVNNPDELLTMFRDYFSEITVFCTTRNQISLLESLYNQNVKSPAVRYNKGIRDFIVDFNFYEKYNYENLKKRWESSDCFIYHPFESSILPHDKIIDLFSIPKSSLVIESNTQKNSSISNEYLIYLLTSNKENLDIKNHKKILRTLRALPKKSNTTLIDPELLVEVNEFFNLSNSRLNEKLGYEAVKNDFNSEKVYLDIASTFNIERYSELINNEKSN